jgi:hypothetical protein
LRWGRGCPTFFERMALCWRERAGFFDALDIGGPHGLHPREPVSAMAEGLRPRLRAEQATLCGALKSSLRRHGKLYFGQSGPFASTWFPIG